MAAPTQDAGAAQAPGRSMGDAAPAAAPEGPSTLGALVGDPAQRSDSRRRNSQHDSPHSDSRHSDSPRSARAGTRVDGAARASHAEPLEPEGALTRLKESVWYKVVGKGLALGALLTALAVIGSWSTLHAKGEPEAPAQASGPPGDGRDAEEWLRAPAEPPAHQPSASKRPRESQPDEPDSLQARAGFKPAPTSDEQARRQPQEPSGHGSSLGDAPSQAKSDGEAPPSERPPGVTPDGKVILNTATAEDFVKLPGVGPSRAEAIIKLRTRLKRFRKVSDLLRVRGIGVRSLKRIQPLVVLDPPPPPAPPSEGADAGAAAPAKP
ncbi:MAG: helix-hairpin-helix domain-containing protein [Polyangiaceae bacterium]|nr:helix-hairpin-helix domain-containing protein [Polyangiaceae bacterium]MCW5788953.1 helix-hairpin-helix domain-containing protein [Polyangiaceae bacterium]